MPCKNRDLIFKPWINKPDSYANGDFTFLNITKSLLTRDKDALRLVVKSIWNDESNGKLWAYNLNYMDYLLQSEIDVKEGLQIIDLFINDVIDNRIGLEPYPISLRVVNWIKFLSKITSETKQESYLPVSIAKINGALNAQLLILSENIEYNILGNHLLENAFALLFGAFYFADETLWEISHKILDEELDEQILSDGEHFEQSPMYQQIILDRLFDSINLLKNNFVFSNQDNLLEKMKQKAGLMLQWLNYFTYSNGQIPLLNDSTLRNSPTTYQLNDYWFRLGNDMNMLSDYKPSCDSSYYKFSNPNYECILDTGLNFPLYQPGHSHADAFTFELYVRGVPVIVDTGISTYSRNDRRLVERGTISHNTITIDNINSSNVWASHRVGKRAEAKIIEFGNDKVSMVHNGYKDFGILVQRTFKSDDKLITITDTILPCEVFKGSRHRTGKIKEITGRLHFHPLRKIACHDNKIFIDDVTIISVDGHTNLKISEYYYAPEFNKLIKSNVVEMNFNRKSVMTISILGTN